MFYEYAFGFFCITTPIALVLIALMLGQLNANLGDIRWAMTAFVALYRKDVTR